MPRRRSKKKRSALVKRMTPEELLLADLRALIETARSDVARVVNAGLVQLYWQIGRRIQMEILKEERAGYGEEIVAAL